MSWVTFEASSGGFVVVQLTHVVAIYDEQGEVKLAASSVCSPSSGGRMIPAGGSDSLIGHPAVW